MALPGKRCGHGHGRTASPLRPQPRSNDGWCSTAGLFLVYTRRAAENKKVIRWRAPLFMAEVDAKHLHLKRATEQVIFPLVPDARYGNFHAAAITEELACIFCTEETSKEMHYRGDTLLMRIRRSGSRG